MFDLITIGSATLDVIVKSSQFSLEPHGEEGISLCQMYGGKMDAEEFLMTSGGGATNVAVGASRLGLRTATVCELGKDFPAQVIWNDLQQDEVETRFLVSEKLEETAVSIILVAKEGGRTAITHRGAASQLESRDIPWEEIENTRWIHLGSLGGNKQLIFDLLDFCQRREIGVSWTPSMSDLTVFLKNQLSIKYLQLDVLLLNAEEWAEFDTLQDKVLEQVSFVVVTDGKKGGKVYVNSKMDMEYQSLEVKTVEETGAGDSFASAFLSSMLLENSLATCVEWGKKNAASVVQHLGAKKGLLTREEIER